MNNDRFVGRQDITPIPGIFGKFEDESFIDADCKWKDVNKKIIKDIISFPEETLPFGEMVCGVPYISQELRDLVKNNFRTNDERVLRWTRISALFAMFGLIIAIVLPFCSKVKVNNKQVQHIEKVIKESNQQQRDTVTVNKVKNDTCSTMIIQ